MSTNRTEDKNWLINKKRSLVIFLLLIVWFLFPTYSFTSDLEGEIKVIEVQGLTSIKKEELIDMICFRAGDTINSRVLRDGIKRAFKKGIFRDIQVVAEPYDNGIKLTYIVIEVLFIEDIDIEGNDEVSKGDIRNSFILKEGEAFHEDLLDKALADLLIFYHRKGFPAVKIATDIREDKETNRISIKLQIDEGRPLIVESINILPEAERRIKTSVGDSFDIERIENDIKRLKKYYRKKDYLKPAIGPYSFEKGLLEIPIIPGSRLEMVFLGNSAFSSRTLSKEMPFFEDEKVTVDLLRDAVSRIQKLYQRDGYYYAKVTGAIEKTEGLIKTTFFIFEGEEIKLREMRFDGCSVSLEAVKSITPLEEGEPFDSNLLSAARESIVEFYNALGYLDADVIDIRKEFLENGREVDIIFIIYQGPQVRIKEINVSGNKVLSAVEIRNALRIEEEDTYNSIDIADARRRVLSLYSRFGYINAKVDVESTIIGGMVLIKFSVTENEPFVFGKVILRGNELTKPKIIKRELTIREGESYNHEEIFRTRQQLHKLGLFTDINIDPLGTASPREVDEEGDEIHLQDVLVDVTEAKPGAVEVGLGYGDYEQMRGFIDLSYQNLGGYNRRIGLRTELSSIDERHILNFREPWFLNKPRLVFKSFLIKESKRAYNFDTNDVIYKIDRLSLLAGVEKELAENLKGSLDYEYSIVDTFDVEPGVILSKEDTGSTAIGSISPSLFYDTRDDPFNPTSGSLKGVVLKFASSAFLSDTDFLKTAVQSSWYFRIKKGLIFAFAAKGGASYGFGDTEEIPIIERFFLGGRTTVRGYNQNTLGPKGRDNIPTGGNAYFLTNAEFRISLGKGFGLATFVDGGNVWQKTGDVDASLQYTTGMGFRYSTPVGPVRIDYGHKLNRRPGESTGELHFSFGHAF